MRQERLARRFIVCGDPAHAQPREREHLRHAAHGDALFIAVGDGLAPAVLLRQVAVDLVAEDVRAHAAGDLHDAPQQFLTHQRAGGVVGVVDADHFRLGRDEALEFVQVGEIVVFLL